MKKNFSLFIVFIGMVSLMSFAWTDFQKTIIGKWEMKSIQQPGKPAMETKEMLGDFFLQFNSDFTYVESTGKNTKNGVWKITNGKYLQTKTEKQTDFTEKMELIEISTDQIQMKNSTKTILTFNRVK